MSWNNNYQQNQWNQNQQNHQNVYRQNNQQAWAQPNQAATGFAAYGSAAANTGAGAYNSAGSYGIAAQKMTGYGQAPTAAYGTVPNQHGAYGRSHQPNTGRTVQVTSTNNTPYRAQPSTGQVNSLPNFNHRSNNPYSTDSSKKSLVAAVTKIHEKFCFIDSDIFCQLSLFRLLG